MARLASARHRTAARLLSDLTIGLGLVAAINHAFVGDLVGEPAAQLSVAVVY